METLAIILTLAAVAFATQKGVDPQWMAFKRSFNKTYGSDAEETMRHKIWRQNVRKIEHHNLNADLNMLSYRLGINAYSDLSPEEFRSKMLGFRMNLKKTGSEGSTFLVPNNIEIPDSIDWRTKGYVTPVKDQGTCGSCWAFSAIGSLEGQHFRKTGKLVSLSEQNLVDCSSKNGGCDGGLMDIAFKYIKDNKGIDTERSYPYTAKDGDHCLFKRAFVGATDTGYVDIPSGNVEKLKAACATVGPISIAIDSSSVDFQFYRGGVFDGDCSPDDINHGVLLVGYGTFEGQDYWLVKNSWGTSWGMKGYIMIARNKSNMCGVASMSSYPTV